MERSYRFKAQGFDLERLAQRICSVMNTDTEELFAPGKEQSRVRARSLYCYLAARELGISQIHLSKQLKLSPTAITFAVKRGERLAREMNFVLE
jgi:chromosomal replication initiation ATPase DnaA